MSDDETKHAEVIRYSLRLEPLRGPELRVTVYYDDIEIEVRGLVARRSIEKWHGIARELAEAERAISDVVTAERDIHANHCRALLTCADISYAMELSDLLRRIAAGLRTHGFSVTAEEIYAALAKPLTTDGAIKEKAPDVELNEQMQRVATKIVEGSHSMDAEHHRAADALMAGEPLTVNLRAAATKMRDEYLKEFHSTRAEVMGWVGWVDGFDPREPVDAAYLALDAALKSSVPRTEEKL